MFVEGEWNIGAYRWKANGELMERYLQGFKEKKIVGSFCKSCGRVYVPPREICGRCFLKISDFVQVSNYGRVLAFLVSPPLKKGKVVIAGIDVVTAGILKEGEQIILAMVRFDGSSSTLVLPLLNVKPEDVRVGMRVKAVWVDEPRGKLSDLVGVEPAEDITYTQS